jgi:hypothetical protein
MASTPEPVALGNTSRTGRSDWALAKPGTPLKMVVAATLPTDNSALRRLTKVEFGIARSPELWVLAERADIRAQI